MSWRTRRVLRALRWLVVCAVLFVPLRAPVFEPLVDATVLVADTRSEADRVEERRTVVGATFIRPISVTAPESSAPANSPRAERLYLLHAALLL
jgi:hypothetical protein